MAPLTSGKHLSQPEVFLVYSLLFHFTSPLKFIYFYPCWNLDWSFFRAIYKFPSPPFPFTESPQSPQLPPVPTDQVLDLINTLKSDKALGPDNFLSEILTSNPHWCAEPLAKLFTLVNSTGKIPQTWLSSVIIPIYKKGDASKPGNYRPISLLFNIGKLYSKFLLTKLLSWVQSQNLPGMEQTGFCAGASTTDHVFLLSFFSWKIFHLPSFQSLCCLYWS